MQSLNQINDLALNAQAILHCTLRAWLPALASAAQPEPPASQGAPMVDPPRGEFVGRAAPIKKSGPYPARKTPNIDHSTT